MGKMERIGRKGSDYTTLEWDVPQLITSFLTGQYNVKMFIQSFEAKDTLNISINYRQLVFQYGKCYTVPLMRTHLEITDIFKLLGRIYLQISASMRMQREALLHGTHTAKKPPSHKKPEYKPSISCYCTKVHCILKHKILFLFLLSQALLLRNSDYKSS